MWLLIVPLLLEGTPCDGTGLLAPDARAGTLTRTITYADRGDRVIAGETLGPLRCVIAFDGEGSSQLWVRTDTIRLDRRTGAGGLDGAWSGVNVDARITIRDGHATGDAVWHGYGDNTHEGAFEGTGTPQAGLLAITEDSCEVRMRRIGPYLVVDDNRECGGANVTFAGVYERR